ncbi:MAG TPA: alanyl-tRNA editing protein [Candidatus Blautia excrementipullorum]|nr:alanyl-tRNA editing protein [Candidatus Blautia excrementipullorum]
MTETKRLYYEDVYTREFHGEVRECRKAEKGYQILLDQSAFYPEGGGQPCDLGTLNGIAVTDVQEEGGELIHYTAEPLEPGTAVEGQIDWERRFDLMQQHSGEHMVSGLVHQAYGYQNVGFHMGSDVITIDFSGVLTKDQLAEIEEKTNEKIWENSAVKIFYPSEEERKSLPYRSKKDLEGKIRLVEFPGADLCACCGTHVAHTGEIGMVKILGVENFREGVRVTMISGKRVLDYLNGINEQNRRISVKLSAKTEETAQAVERLWEENYRLKGQLLHLEQELCRTEADRWEGAGSVLLFHEGLDADSVRRMADAVMQKCAGCCAVFSKNPDGTYKYAIGEKDGDLRQFVREMNQALNGRGGGKPFFAQGSVKATEEEIRRFFRQ